MTASDAHDDRPDTDPDVPPAHGPGPHGTYGGRASVESDAEAAAPDESYGGRSAAPDDEESVTDETYGGGPAGPDAADAGRSAATDPDGTERTEERTR